MNTQTQVGVHRSCLSRLPRSVAVPLRADPRRRDGVVLPGREDVPRGPTRQICLTDSTEGHFPVVVCGSAELAGIGPRARSGAVVCVADGDAGLVGRRITADLPFGWVALGGRGLSDMYWAVDAAAVDAGRLNGQRRRWGDGDSQIFDCFEPADASVDAPLAVLFHGGFWRSQWTMDTTMPIAAALAADGWRVVNVEYPVVGAGCEDGVVMIEQLRRCLVPQLLDVWRSPDESPMIVLGHSAGGQLAALFADAIGQHVTATVLQAPLLDLPQADRLSLGGGAVAALGVTDGLERISPHHVMTGTAPILIVHGHDDDRVPVALSHQFAMPRGNVDLLELDGAHHLDHLRPESEAWQRTYDWIVSIVGGPHAR